MRRLSVALDAFAALRDHCGGGELRLSAAGMLAELAGADAVRIGHADGCSADRERQVRELRDAVARLELRVAASQPGLKHALEIQPDLVVLAMEVRNEDARSTVLDCRAETPALVALLRALREAAIPAAALIAPSVEALKAAHAAGFEQVELHWPAALGAPEAALANLADAARLAAKLRIGVGLGGGLGIRDLDRVLGAAPGAESVAVGRAIAARAALVGIERAVRALRDRIG